MKTQRATQYRLMPYPLPLPFRIGHGYDIHRLKRGGRLMMGGVEVATGISPIAHSDGDVVLHALVDALLGAMGMGDIGEHFPNEPAWKDAPSRVFVEQVHREITQLGYGVMNVDVTVQAERPRLKEFKLAMVETIASLLGVMGEQVNVKAGTNEGCDAVGKGKAVAAHVVVLLERVGKGRKRGAKTTVRARR
jgi:2-C-methyl-D-erythritol 2,4-cyclodiphosphate synthase